MAINRIVAGISAFVKAPFSPAPTEAEISARFGETLPLSPTVVCREALVTFHRFRADIARGDLDVENVSREVYRHVDLQFMLDDLSLSLDAFAERFIAPAMRMFARSFDKDAVFRSEPIPIPSGKYYGIELGASERYNGIAMRVVMAKDWPPHHVMRFDVWLAA